MREPRCPCEYCSEEQNYVCWNDLKTECSAYKKWGLAKTQSESTQKEEVTPLSTNSQKGASSN